MKLRPIYTATGSDGATNIQASELSRKFWSGKNFGPRTNFLKKIGPGGPYFSEKNGPPMKKKVHPQKWYVRSVGDRLVIEQQLDTSVLLCLTDKTFCTPFYAGTIQLWDARNNNVTPGSATEKETTSVSAGTAGGVPARPY